MARRLGSNEPRAVLACLDGAILSWSGAGDCLRGSPIPCLFYAGDVDPFHTRASEAAQELPKASFVSLPGLDHIQAWFAPDLVLPHATSFLTKVSKESA